MTNFYEALEKIGEIQYSLPEEYTELRNCTGRILREDIISDVDMPPFDKSAMDGYACRSEDLKDELKVLGTLHAGSNDSFSVTPGSCVRIMTGAPVPEGADTVIMVEHTRETGKDRIRFTGSSTKSNICSRGEDVRKGAKLLHKGTRLLPQHVAVLASAGYARVKVSKLPRIVILSTGSELVEPEIIPGPSQIRNSNAYNLIGQLMAIGLPAAYEGIVADEEYVIRDRIGKLLEKYDVVLLTGGVSLGEHDFVGKILREHKLDLLFEKVAIQPGKPVALAAGDQKVCFGLSGNPVSSFLQMEILVKPLLFHLMKGKYEHPVIFVELAEPMSRKNASRLKFFPVQFNEKGQVSEIRFNGSAHITGLTEADGFGMFPEECEALDAGDRIEVLLIR